MKYLALIPEFLAAIAILGSPAIAAWAYYLATGNILQF